MPRDPKTPRPPLSNLEAVTRVMRVMQRLPSDPARRRVARTVADLYEPEPVEAVVRGERDGSLPTTVRKA